MANAIVRAPVQGRRTKAKHAVKQHSVKPEGCRKVGLSASGQVITDPQEVAFITAFRKLDPDGRQTLQTHLRDEASRFAGGCVRSMARRLLARLEGSQNAQSAGVR